MSEALFSFGDGRVILIDPDSARNAKERIEIARDNRRWLMRLVTIYEAHDARTGKNE